MVVASPAKPGAGQVGHLVGVRVVDRYGARFFASGQGLIADASKTLTKCRRMNPAPRLRSPEDGRRGVTDDDTDGDTILDCLDQCAGWTTGSTPITTACRIVSRGFPPSLPGVLSSWHFSCSPPVRSPSGGRPGRRDDSPPNLSRVSYHCTLDGIPPFAATGQNGI